jgi:protein TonB
MTNSRLQCAIAASLLLFVVAGIAEESADFDHLLNDSADRKPLHTMAPIYPERARRDRLEGEVEVCFNVDRKGHTSRIAVRRSTHRLFERPAILAIRASTYYPLAEGQEVSGIKTCRTFRFRLTPVAIEQP